MTQPREENKPQEFSSYAPTQATVSDDAYGQFLKTFPEYRLTSTLDTLRQSDFTRLDTTGETYADYMGGAIYPESLVRIHTEFLNRNVFGNTHSVSNSSTLSLECANEARAAVLSFFRASPEEYTVVFTANASGALKIVGESYPFVDDSSYVLSADSHNSVNGIRKFATHGGARVSYIPPTATGGFETEIAENILRENRSPSAPCLFALTGQSNVTNTKNPLSIVEYAKSLGYHVLLDAAALAATSSISLSETPVDAMAVSFYKMFGFPTGVGALIAKKSFLKQLKRPWFAGGTVDVVQVFGTIVTLSEVLHEQFEDGTINYLSLPSITAGLRFLSGYMPFLPLRTFLRHESTGKPSLRILSATPSRRLKSVGEQSDTGSIISLLFLSPTGEILPNSFVEYAAAKNNISLRTGCMCNPGGAAAMRLNFQNEKCRLYEGATLKEYEATVGHQVGVVRISLGLASNFQDVWHVVRFAELIATRKSYAALWNQYVNDSSTD
ncbi:PLP-dependent transferase [Roridomyces roridus]|uniref:PLP-dependent transferase n=1 Tax=Roridomyces roridus TaxID=1738132 RepID=A0AAD7B844_9AGAR|nr:PLP-dependent transferase [Roridomyces roridus]